MSEFDDEATPLPPTAPAQRDPLFPTGRQPRIARGALAPHAATAATTRMWSTSRQADTTRMSAREIAASIPLAAPAEDPMRTLRVESVVFHPIAPPSLRARLRPWLAPAIAFATGFAIGALVL